MEVIHGPRPPSVQWPLVRRQGQKQGEASWCRASPSKGPGAVEKWPRFETALQALGPDQPGARSTLKEALRRKMRGSQCTRQRFAEACARVAKFEAVVKGLGEDNPDAEFLKIAFKNASVEKRFDVCFQKHCPGQDTNGAKQKSRFEKQRKSRSGWRGVGPRVAGFGRFAWRGVGTASIVPRTEHRGGTQRGDHQMVVELQFERQTTKKPGQFVPRKQEHWPQTSTDFAPVQGGHGHNAQNVMLTPINAANSNLRESKRGVP